MRRYQRCWPTFCLLFAVAVVLSGCSCLQKKSLSAEAEYGFVHMVFFYWSDEANSAQKEQLIQDCFNYLGSVETVRNIEVGRPAGTPREVVDNTYGVCLIVYFDDKEGHDYYQKADEHLEFIARNQETWARVQVYDMLPFSR